MKRTNISSGARWEDIVGYSRAVRIGNLVEVSGTTAIDDKGELVGAGSFYEQTKFIISKIEKALHQAGASLEDVVRTRMYVTDATQWAEVGRAHGEYFGQIKPVTTLVGIKELIDERMWVEIEATAIIGED